MNAEPTSGRRLTREELARAVPTLPLEVDELTTRGMLLPGADGLFRPSDIQRVRAVIAMRSPGIDLDQLVAAFREELFTLQPMDVLYPDPPSVTELTTSELAVQLGMEPHDLIRLVVALGSPAPRPDTLMRTDEAELLRLLVDIGTKLGGRDALMRAARVFGDSTRRAAESAVAIFDENINSPVVRARPDDAKRMQVNRLAAELMAKSEELIAGLYRRHLEHTLLRFWTNSAEQFLDELGVRPASPVSRGMAFVDLSGFTRMTESAGDAVAARLATRLGELAESAAAGQRGRVVKLLGDGAMLHFDDPLDAVRGALDLLESIDASGLPPAHAGVHAGPVIERDGDYFGRTVNIAARVSAVAAPRQVLVTAQVAQQRANDLQFERVANPDLKDVGPLELFVARRTRGADRS